MKCLCDICETPDCKRKGCKFPIIHDVASEKEESAPSAIHNSGSTSIAEIADEMHAFAVKHFHGKPIYAVAHIERWSRQLRECR